MCKSSSELSATVEALQAQIRALSERVSRLEGAQPAQVKPVAARSGAANGDGAVSTKATTKEIAPAPVAEAIPEEILLVISAAVAAFLGERPHIRQIRLISSPLWATQGRVSIQASHRLHH